jgi:WD40 repeat protein
MATPHRILKTADGKIYLDILKGDIDKYAFEHVQKAVPKSKMELFISSTFTDSHHERNILQEKILPVLQAISLKHEVQVIFYDMRFGVKDENTIDHMTWNVCRDAITNCYNESDGLFFLSLQGDKYGYMPLPKYILKYFTLELFARDGIQEKITLAKKWYQEDQNHLPTRFELRNLKSANEKEFWEHVVPILRNDLFDNMHFEVLPNSEQQHLIINRSVTEWETLYALALDTKNCYWIKRKFDFKTSSHEGNFSREDLCDTVFDPQKKEKLANLHRRVTKALLPEKRILELANIISPESYIAKDDDALQYLATWEKAVTDILVRELNKIIERAKKWTAINLKPLFLPMEYFLEMLHHCKIAYLKSAQFFEREELIEKTLQSILQGEARNLSNSFAGVTLAVIGKSGTGKTAIMARLAMEIRRTEKKLVALEKKSKKTLEHQDADIVDIFMRLLDDPEKAKAEDIRPPVIVRFCGTSKYSLHGIDLVHSICMQILCIYQQAGQLTDYIINMANESYEDTVSFFHVLIAEYPVYLFIDSLDQLSNTNEERRQLTFLKNIRPHHSSRIIVSTLPDEYDEANKKWKYLYFCEKKLKDNQVPFIEIVNSSEAGTKEILTILDRLLIAHDRRIDSNQWFVVRRAVAEEPTVLYVTLALEVISKWKSCDGNNVLQPTVRGVIHQIFDDVERYYGRQFTTHAFAYITFSREGINDNEMKDLLGLNEHVLEEVFQYSSLKSFPMHVWLRLKFIIRNLITVKENHCIKWFHRQLWETAQERYAFIKMPCQKIMGKYFSNNVDKRLLQERGIHTQPLTLNKLVIWFSESIVNRRRTFESVHNLLNGGAIKEAILEICNLEMICAAILLGDAFKILGYLGEAVEYLNRGIQLDNEIKQKCLDYYRWLRKEMTQIVSNPRRRVLTSASEEPLASAVHGDLCSFLTRSSFIGSSDFSSRSEDPLWLKERSLSGQQNFNDLLMNLQGHLYSVWCVAWTHDGKAIASGSRDNTIRIWNAVTGDVINMFTGHENTVLALSFNADSTKLVSGSNHDGIVMIWDVISGDTECSFAAHASTVLCVDWNPRSDAIATGSEDMTVKIWDTKGNLLKKFDSLEGSVWSLSWNYKGNLLLSGTADKSIRIWHFDDESASSVIPDSHLGSILCVSWSPDGSLFASASQDSKIKVWDVQLQLRTTLEGHSGFVWDLSWNYDGSKLASCSADNTIHIWDPIQGLLLQVLRGHHDIVYAVDWMKYSENKLVSCSEDKTIRVWNPSSSTTFTPPHQTESIRHGITTVAWNPSSDSILSTDKNGHIRIWEEYSGRIIRSFGPIPLVRSASWSSTGNEISCSLFDNSVVVLDESTGHRVNSSEKDFGIVIAAAWTYSGRKVAFSSDGNITNIFHCLPDSIGLSVEDNIKELMFYDSVKGSSWNYLEDEHIEATVLNIWNLQTRKLEMTLEGHRNVISSVAWNGDDTCLASGSKDKTVKVWNLATGKIQRTLTGHRFTVRTLAWNPISREVLASGSDDKVIRIWNVLDGQVLHILKGHAESVLTVSWKFDGTKLASGSQDGMIKIWEAIRFKGDTRKMERAPNRKLSSFFLSLASLKYGSAKKIDPNISNKEN